MNPRPLPSSAGRAAMLLVVSSALTFGPTVLAQQRMKVAYETPAANTKYTQQHTLEVGDRPGHLVRLFEIQRTYPADPPVIDGMRLKETWTRGMSDYVEQNGLANVYTVYVMENGDRFWARGVVAAHGATAADGKADLKNMSSLTIEGGTGKFANIRGIVRSEGAANLSTGYNHNKTELEYWMAK